MMSARAGFVASGLLAAVLLLGACANSAAPITTGEPAVIRDQFPATDETAAAAEVPSAALSQSDEEPAENAALGTADETQADETNDEPSTTASDPQTTAPIDADNPGATTQAEPVAASEHCSDASEIRTGWVTSPIESIAAAGRGFPEDLLICDDVPELVGQVECMPFRTERIFMMLADLYAEQAAPLTEAAVVFCVGLS